MKKLKLKKGQIVVFKLSSLAVTFEHGGIHNSQVNNIISDIMKLKKDFDIKPVIVSSGAINAGRKILKNVDKEMPALQACSSVGQLLLMENFQKKFNRKKQQISQILLTHEDLKNKKRSLNTKNTLNYLLDNDIVPVINENDTVSFDEITFGDNDQLSAMICEMLEAKVLVLLTKANGLFDKDPELKDSKRFEEVAFDEKFDNVSVLTKSLTGKGGMKTKLMAVRKLTPLGVHVFVTTFKGKTPILKALNGANGTHFLPAPIKKGQKKKSWILTRVRTHAHINIDKGAFNALNKDASLLPVGVTGVNGPFLRGDCIQIRYQRKVIAFGISEYSSAEIEKIKRLKSSELGNVLKNVKSTVVIHKDNLILND